MTTIYPNTDDGFVQAKIAHGEANLIIDPVAGTITVKPADPVVQRTVPIQQFRDRLTPSETLAILSAEKTDSQISYAIWLMTTQEDGQLHLDDERVADNLNHLVSLGLLDPGRPAELLK